ncbi:right-handed parallel beta-helix repeat-containing protein [Streptomyces phyllanthi]|uniref:right-handed parallel beta-helix repeat-containing protein n=1 Tax=Streptomyces phyllanthi TaxID=1803180 RepID=UPI002AD23641|nr:right-handed parallel beta-helix repeat-containing protein [Streptomyces phyllanthi]
MNIRGLAMAALLGVTVSGIATPASAHRASSRQAPTVLCGDVAGLVAQIRQVNARGSGSISLWPGCRYRLTAPAEPNGANGLPTITGDLTIIGSSAAISRESTATPFRIAEVAPGGSLSLNGITLSGGSATSAVATSGGGVLTRGTLELVRSRIAGNTASGTGGGLAVASGGRAELTGSAVSGNTGNDGGGVHVGPSGRLTVNGGYLASNTSTFTGGGLANFGTTELNGMSVRDNKANTFEGGGIFTSTGPLTINSSVIRDNTAASDGGGIANFGSSLRLRGSAVYDNAAGGQGGGIFHQRGSVALTLTSVARNTPDNCAPPGSVPGCSL